MPSDAQGHELSGSPDSAAAYDAAVADYYALGGNPVGKLKAALAAKRACPAALAKRSFQPRRLDGDA